MADFVSGYNIIQKLGDGARSQVYQVVQPSTGEVFALKRVVREQHEDTRFLDQAINEFSVSKQLDHPSLRQSIELKHVRKLFRLIEVQVVMEYVDGVGLNRHRPNGADKATDLFIKVAEGLESMHERGYLHADIKPNNILLTYDGGVKIIDFGQCCEIGFKKPRIQGTPDYIAPEQVERRNLTEQTDVYNLGATLYWALTGQTYPTVITQKRKKKEVRAPESVQSPQEINPEIPSTLSRLVMECCEFERRHRPKSMRDVINRLETAHHVIAKRQRAETTSDDESASEQPPQTDRHDDKYDFSAFSDLGPDTEKDPNPGGDS